MTSGILPSFNPAKEAIANKGAERPKCQVDQAPEGRGTGAGQLPVTGRVGEPQEKAFLWLNEQMLQIKS